MRVLPAVLLAASLAAPALAQTKPDFSGTWKLNRDKSDPPPQMGGGPEGRPGSAPGANPMQDISLYITQFESKLIIEQKMGEQTRMLTYYLDGRESTNPAMRGNEMKTLSRWEEGSLVTEGENTFNSPMGEMKVKTKDVRTLSDDGKTMTVASTFTTPQGERTRKTVYDKQ